VRGLVEQHLDVLPIHSPGLILNIFYFSLSRKRRRKKKEKEKRKKTFRLCDQNKLRHFHLRQPAVCYPTSTISHSDQMNIEREEGERNRALDN
jgi:hypothetical protein